MPSERSANCVKLITVIMDAIVIRQSKMTKVNQHHRSATVTWLFA